MTGWNKLLSQLTAINSLNIVSRDEPRLNDRGTRILRYLQKRQERAEEEEATCRAYVAEEDTRWAKR